MKLRLAVIVFLVALWTEPALAQGCAMCYSNAAGTTRDGQRAISRAVLVLLLPPLGFMTAGMGLAFRYGKKRDRDVEHEIAPQDEGCLVRKETPLIAEHSWEEY